MRISRSLSALPGVDEAALMIGTPPTRRSCATRDCLRRKRKPRSPRPHHRRARRRRSGRERGARRHSMRSWRRQPGTLRQAASAHARTPGSALQLLPGANLALISVPGDSPPPKRARALRAGLHVMMFSDNVPLDDERRLKQLAQERGLLVMGPDCGTAHHRRRAARLRQCRAARRHRHRRRVGHRPAGSVDARRARRRRHLARHRRRRARPRRDAIGGITTLMAIDALDADPATRISC